MKPFFATLVLFFSISYGYAQWPSPLVKFGDNVSATDTCGEFYIYFSPGNTPGNRVVVGKVKSDSLFIITSKKFKLGHLADTGSINSGQPTNLVWVRPDGTVVRSPVSLLSVPASQVSGLTDSLAKYAPYPPKRILSFTGVTDASGNYTVTYPTVFTSIPLIVPVQVPGAIRQELYVASSTTTGFTIRLQQRNEVLGLLPTYPVVAGATITVFVIEK